MSEDTEIGQYFLKRVGRFYACNCSVCGDIIFTTKTSQVAALEEAKLWGWQPYQEADGRWSIRCPRHPDAGVDFPDPEET